MSKFQPDIRRIAVGDGANATIPIDARDHEVVQFKLGTNVMRGNMN